MQLHACYRLSFSCRTVFVLVWICYARYGLNTIYCTVFDLIVFKRDDICNWPFFKCRFFIINFINLILLININFFNFPNILLTHLCRFTCVPIQKQLHKKRISIVYHQWRSCFSGLIFIFFLNYFIIFCSLIVLITIVTIVFHYSEY